MFPPRPATHRLVLRELVRGAVVQAGEVLERVGGHLFGGNPELVLELSDGGSLGAGDGSGGDVRVVVHFRGLVAVQGV